MPSITQDDLAAARTAALLVISEASAFVGHAAETPRQPREGLLEEPIGPFLANEADRLHRAIERAAEQIEPIHEFLLSHVAATPASIEWVPTGQQPLAFSKATAHALAKDYAWRVYRTFRDAAEAADAFNSALDDFDETPEAFHEAADDFDDNSRPVDSVLVEKRLPEIQGAMQRYARCDTSRLAAMVQIESRAAGEALANAHQFAPTSLAIAPRGPVTLSPAEKDIVDIIREIGPDGNRSQSAILDALSQKGKTPSTGTTKTVLAAMVRHGILLDGYRLPEWQ